jgi:glycosyltransferase involved in cell wall biosynthesis
MTVLIPAYEPTEKMLALILKLQAQTDDPILIIDDGSGEHYQALFDRAESYGCIVLRHAQNQGKGAALKTGFNYLLAMGMKDNVVCADSDGQHSVADIIRVAGAVQNERQEMVLGVREFSGKVPLKSRFGNSVTAFFFRLATRLAIKDTQTGLRGYPHELLPWLCSVEGTRFEYELNLLLKAKPAGIKIRQVPIETIYDDNNQGTHFRAVEDSIRVFLPLLKFGGSSLSSGVLDFCLLFLFQGLTGSLFWSVALARAISSVFNYTLNKVFVFGARNVSGKQSAPKYFGLVLVILAANYSLLALLTQVLPGVPAKLLTEIALFGLSYMVQRYIIFKRHNPKNIRRKELPAKQLPVKQIQYSKSH